MLVSHMAPLQQLQAAMRKQPPQQMAPALLKGHPAPSCCAQLQHLLRVIDQDRRKGKWRVQAMQDPSELPPVVSMSHPNAAILQSGGKAQASEHDSPCQRQQQQQKSVCQRSG